MSDKFKSRQERSIQQAEDLMQVLVRFSGWELSEPSPIMYFKGRKGQWASCRVVVRGIEIKAIVVTACLERNPQGIEQLAVERTMVQGDFYEIKKVMDQAEEKVRW